MCGSWPYSGCGSGRKSAAQPALSGRPVVAAVDGLEHASAGEAEVEVVGGRGGRPSPSGASSRRVCPRRRATPPTSPQRGWSFQPATGAQVSPPSSVRNRPCGEPPAYQDARLVGMARREPEHRAEGPPVGIAFGEGRRAARLLPREAEVVGAEHGRTEVPGAARRQEGGAVARVQHHVLDDVARGTSDRRPPRSRAPSLARIHAPFRVPTRSLGPSRSAGIASPAGSHSGRPNDTVESIVWVIVPE